MSIKKNLEWYTQSCVGAFLGGGNTDSFLSSFFLSLYFLGFPGAVKRVLGKNKIKKY